MEKENKAPYIFLVGLMRIIVIVYGVYLAGIMIFNITLKETRGEIVNIHEYEETYIYPRMTHEVREWRKDIYYQYDARGIKYTGKRISNLLIFPDLDIALNGKTTVYFSPLFPGYSVLFKGDPVYNFYNIIPIIILGIIMYIIKTKNHLHKNTTKGNEEIIIKSAEVHEEDTNNYSESMEMEDIFIDEIGKGEKEIKFLSVLNESDGMIIESLFKSEQIPYKINFSQKNKSYGNSIFYILERDYSDALFVLEEYMNSKKDDKNDKIEIYRKRYGT
jgi:hypothetical protein